MYDHIKIGDLVCLKRRIKMGTDKRKDVCIVLSKEKLDNEFLFKLFYRNSIKTYDTTHYHKNITIELVEDV